ncbi:MAG: DUF5678 domain-containing protein [Candidatus Woesearchaeota archaeon]|jgi:hypothetical protein
MKEYNENAKDWLKQCKSTYQRELPNLVKERPGEFVAINGNNIVEIGSNLDCLLDKYESIGAPSVKIYQIPKKKDQKAENLDDMLVIVPEKFLPE